MTTTRAAIAAVLAPLAWATGLVVAGCGGSDPAPTAALAADVPTPTPTPDCGLGFVPFDRIHSVSAAAPNGDRVVVGPLAAASVQPFRDLRLPSTTDERFCRDVVLGPSYTGPAYVPTQAEKAGDFSKMPVVIVDPLTGQPFPRNRIPPERFPSVVGWRIPGP